MAVVGGARRTLAWTSPGAQLTACSAIHAVNDALFVAFLPLLPLMAADLGLTYAQVGAIKTAFNGGSSVLQVPSGMLAERFGEHVLLAVGNGWVGAGMVAMALSASYWQLLVLGLLAGAGGGTQHPVATSLVSRLFEDRRRATAIGTLNFAGDVGKVVVPLLTGLVIATSGWRGGLLLLGGLGTVFSLLYWLTMRGAASDGAAASSAPDGGQEGAPIPGWGGSWGIRRPGLFSTLTIIGMLDSAARGASLTFIPFLLQQKGFDAGAMSLFFTALFCAGAAGKFLCGPLADRYGNLVTIVVTELVTAGALAALLGTPPALMLLAILPLGFVLNGTSSVLYATVASLVDQRRRARGYGLYYTSVMLASAAAPILYGLLADRAGLGPTFVTMAAVTALIVPITLVAGRDLRV